MAIVTISRGTLSGGEALAECLASRLGISAISREVIRDAASRFGIAENLLDRQLHKVPSLVQRRLGSSEERRLYLVAIQTALAERAREGDYIYHGNAGHLLLKKLPGVFKVRLIAPVAYRVRMVMEKQGLSKEGAAKYIEQVDKARSVWTKFLYGVDWLDPSLYDVVINLEFMSLDTACSMIEKGVQQPEFRNTPERKKIVDAFALACEIQLKLAQEDRTKGMHLDVEVSDHVARIKGKFLSTGPLTTGLQRSEEDVMEVVRQFKEIKKVEFNLAGAGIPVET
jgi:cytidylate kinase